VLTSKKTNHLLKGIAMKTYSFSISIVGSGEDFQAAWQDAVLNFSLDPGDPPGIPWEKTLIDDDEAPALPRPRKAEAAAKEALNSILQRFAAGIRHHEAQFGGKKEYLGAAPEYNPAFIRKIAGAAALVKAVLETGKAPAVIIEVSGGVAEVTACPEGIIWKIIDHDNR